MRRFCQLRPVIKFRDCTLSFTKTAKFNLQQKRPFFRSAGPGSHRSSHRKPLRVGPIHALGHHEEHHENLGASKWWPDKSCYKWHQVFQAQLQTGTSLIEIQPYHKPLQCPTNGKNVFHVPCSKTFRSCRLSKTSMKPWQSFSSASSISLGRFEIFTRNPRSSAPKQQD